jgi:phosphoglycolate phosphatase
MSHPHLNLLFDLDGTLTDPVVGITRCIQHAMSGLGRPIPAASALRRFIGPPLRGTFAELLTTQDEDLIARAIALYRERFAVAGMFENEVYPDVVAGLDELRADGHHLWVVTSKPEVYARTIVAHFGLSSCFSEIYGAELDGRNSDKADLVRVVLAKERLDSGRTWMIGDRGHDVRGGRMNGTRTAGVLWGYGTDAELRAERPDLVTARMSDLVNHMRLSTSLS